MSTIVLIRPGCTDYHAQSRLLGTLEMPMNDLGLEQVEEAVLQLKEKGIKLQAVLASPTDPAFGTARAIADAQGGVKVKELEELRNVDQGLWQGLPEADVRKRYPKVFRTGRQTPQSICPPEGETLGDACLRIQKVLNKAIKKHDVFAIVVCDPIATVIRCTLQQRSPALNACLCGEDHRQAVEVFESSTFDSQAFVNAVLSSTPAATEQLEASEHATVEAIQGATSHDSVTQDAVTPAPTAQDSVQ